MTAIITKQSLQQMLDDAEAGMRQHIIGRALVVLFERQTKDEQVENATNKHNNVGFKSCDARSGSISAKFYIKNKRLEAWVVDKWMHPQRGFAKICQYHRQLNEAAVEKAAKKAAAEYRAAKQGELL